MSVRIESLDHLVLTVRSIATTCDFYARALGMRAVTFAGDRTALEFGQQKINLHEQGHECEPKATRPTPGSGDLCFIARQPIGEVVAHLTEQQVSIVEGPVPRSGARGPMTSVYCRDPDGNLIEIAVYP
jgi:catechol 2,3-dioxygenase-like lactoylglutathione lyase family enzyme